MKGGVKFGVGSKSVVRSVVKERGSQGTAQALVKEDQEDGNLHTLVGQVRGVTVAVALEQAVGSHLAQVIAQLMEAIARRSQGLGAEESRVNLVGGPAGQTGPAVEEDLH